MPSVNQCRAFLFSLFLLFSTELAADVSIVTSVRPLEFIAKAIVGELGSTSALIGSNDSPHHFNFTPSNRLALSRADVVLWVGPEFEVHMSESLERIVGRASLITASDIEDIDILFMDDRGTVDGHIWLSSHNGITIADRLADTLVKIDTVNSEHYRSNLAEFKETLLTLQESISAQMSDLAGAEYLVYHNGYQYFEQEVGLQHMLAMVTDPETSPSINQIVEVRRAISAAKPKCLISDFEADADLIRTLTIEAPMRVVEVDLLGYNVPLSKSAYGELLSSVSDSFASCIQ